MKVTWTGPARADLRQIRRYIARDSELMADRLVRRLFDASGRLADFPESGRVVPEEGRHEVREIFVGNYRLIYRLIPNEVEVVTVIHGSRLLDTEDLPQ